jgi:hypothetical protein
MEFRSGSNDFYPPGASREPTFGVSGWESSGGFGNFIGGGNSGFAVELPGGADGSKVSSRDRIGCPANAILEQFLSANVILPPKRTRRSR